MKTNVPIDYVGILLTFVFYLYKYTNFLENVIFIKEFFLGIFCNSVKLHGHRLRFVCL